MTTYVCQRCDLTFASMERPLAGLCGICRIELSPKRLLTTTADFKTKGDDAHRERLKRATAKP